MRRMASVVDTRKISKSLEQAGFAKGQADTLAVTFAETTSASREDLVTKDFLKAELAELRADLRTEIAGSKTELIRWMFASQAMLIAALVALANFTKLL